MSLNPSEGLIVFTDGSSDNRNGSGGWAWVALDAFDGILEMSGGAMETTNNRMELQAPMMALAGLVLTCGPSEILIQSDSQYVVRGFMDKGRARHKNVDLWDRLEEAAALHTTVIMEHVRGHKGHTWNERADELAGEARLAELKSSSA